MTAKSLKRAVIQLLENDFSTLDFETSPESDCFITIRPVWSDFGLVEIIEDGGQIIVDWGRFTHSHIDSFNEDSEEQVAEIVESLRHLLGNVIADKVAFWGVRNGAGGCFFVGDSEFQRGQERAHLWSGATVRCSTGARDLGGSVQGDIVTPLPELDVEWMRAEIEKKWLKPAASAGKRPWWKFW